MRSSRLAFILPSACSLSMQVKLPLIPQACAGSPSRCRGAKFQHTRNNILWSHDCICRPAKAAQQAIWGSGTVLDLFYISDILQMRLTHYGSLWWPWQVILICDFHATKAMLSRSWRPWNLQGDLNLNICEAHAFNTHDRFSLDVFVVSGWNGQVSIPHNSIVCLVKTRPSGACVFNGQRTKLFLFAAVRILTDLW